MKRKCNLCESPYKLSRHHFVPREIEADYLAEGNKLPTPLKIWLCRSCHAFIHRTWGHSELAHHLNSKEKLFNNALVNLHIQRRKSEMESFKKRWTKKS